VLPDWNNRIELDESRDTAGVPKPKVTFRIDDYTKAGLAAGLEVSRKVFQQMGVDAMQQNQPYGSNAIIAGTTRMGDDARSSVVDRNLVSHQHRNLYVLGASSHVTAPVNAPSLTIAALAIRAADHIESSLKDALQ
jgi:choline dehydrogenase-like flavoprotein